jgi:GNAT superfamily N-acetyltransferase
MTIVIRRATAADAPAIAALAVALTEEISTVCGFRQFDLDVAATGTLCRALLDEGRYLVLLAERDGGLAGFAGLSEGRALYAGGAIGTLEELYVAPDCRSAGVGAALLNAVHALAGESGWRRLEVCTPPLPPFERSLAFYERHGYAITGGRKLRKLVGADA